MKNIISKGEWLQLQRTAGSLIQRAIKNNHIPHITKHTKCTDCMEPACGYDHRDYRRPLIVSPVCRQCNSKRGNALPLFEDDISSRGHVKSLFDDCIELIPQQYVHIDMQQYDNHISYMANVYLNLDLTIAYKELSKYPIKYRVFKSQP